MQLITLDFETYFDSEYTLKKETVESYVRDPRFKVHCVGIKEGNETYMMRDPAMLGVNKWPVQHEQAVLCHNAQFDGLILSHHYNTKPAFWFDTLSMARLVLPHLKSHSLEALAAHFGLAAKTVPYEEFKGVKDLPPDLYNKLAEGCAHDVNLTHAIFLKLLPSVPPEELRVIDATIRMFTEPVLELDKPRMEAYLAGEQEKKSNALRALGVSKADLQSSAKFAGMLGRLGVACPTKPSPSDPGKQIFAFSKNDEGMKELLNHENETVAALAAARIGEKSTLGETRAKRLIEMAGRGALCVYLTYCGAHTTRWSGGDSLNWQNFTRGSEIRKSIMAPAGHQLVIIDLAQIECRMLNWLAGQEDILEAFRAGRDVYCDAATRALGRRITKSDKLERQLFKTAELGLGYGMGHIKFDSVLKQQGLEGDANQLVRFYRSTHPQVVKLWHTADRILATLEVGYHAEGGYFWGPMELKGKKIVLPNGAALDYSHLRIEGGEYVTEGRRGAAKMYGAKLVENVVQALSRLVLSQAMVKIAVWRRVLLTVHDELVIYCKTEDAQDCLAECLQIMKTPPEWAKDLPLDAEGIISERYSK